jgi:hypothetical protein
VRPLPHLGSLLLGAAVALASVVVHRDAPPFGLVLSVVTTLAVPWWLTGSPWRGTAASYAVGWLATFAAAVAGRPEGDYAIAGDLEGYALMVTGFVLILIGIVSLAGRRRSQT